MVYGELFPSSGKTALFPLLPICEYQNVQPKKTNRSLKLQNSNQVCSSHATIFTIIGLCMFIRIIIQNKSEC